MKHALVTIVPSGTPGGNDIVVSSPAGQAIYYNGFHYLASVIDYPSTDKFQYLLYDSYRHVVYLSAGDHIDVFSLASQNFNKPITVPSNGGTRQILGLALSPDGSKLLAANFSDQSIAIINPDDPSNGAVAVPLPLTGLPYNPGPFQVITTSTNQAFVTTTVGNAATGGSSNIYIIDLSTYAVTAASLPVGSSFATNNNYLQGSTDGSVVLVPGSNISDGPLLSWRAADNTWRVRLVQGQFWNDAAVSGDGNVLAVSSSPDISNFPYPYLMDQLLNLTAQVNFSEFDALAVGPSLQLDQSGALLYGVTGAGIDVIDARTGQLRERILLSEQIVGGPTEQTQTPSKTIAVTPEGSQIVALTSAGITVIQLDAVPIAIGSVTPASGPAGTTVKVRGTGFLAGTSVTVGGIHATSSLLDASTLSVTIPASAPQVSVQFVLMNPDKSSFALDAAFVVQ